MTIVRIVRAASSGGGDPRITPSLVPSRTTGTAPVAVHFDAIGSHSTRVSDPFREITYTFEVVGEDFGNFATDGLPRHRQTGGPLWACVFETPGTYTVRLTCDDGTGTNTTEVQIEVADPDVVYSGTNTICIAPDGTTTGGPAGASYVTSFPALQNDRRYLIKRGSSGHSLDTGGGPTTWQRGQIGAYGSGAKPFLNASTWLFQSAQDITIYDLQTNGSFNLNCGKVLCHRVDIPNPTSGTISFALGATVGADFLNYQNLFLSECTSAGFPEPKTGCSTYGILSSSAIFGCAWGPADQSENRYCGGYKSYVAHNTYPANVWDPPGNTSAIKFHSGGTSVWDESSSGSSYASRYIVIADNQTIGTPNCNWHVAVMPQNAESAEGVEDVILERNAFTHGSSGWESFIQLLGRRITTRGNTRIGGGTCTIDTPFDAASWAVGAAWIGPYYGQLTG